MRLYLMRHGPAVDREDPACPDDALRPLTPRGEARTRKAVLGLEALGVAPDAILTSPLLRAARTAEIAAELLGFPLAGIRTVQALVPGTDPSRLFDAIAESRGERVLCVGHSPQLDDALARALSLRESAFELKKAGVACVKLDRHGPPGELEWLVTPRILRGLARRAGTSAPAAGA